MLSYIGALHHPKPHNVAFGVVGASPLPIAVGKQFSLKTTPVPERVGRARGDRSPEDRRSVRRGPGGGEVDRRPGGGQRRRGGAQHRLRGGRGRARARSSRSSRFTRCRPATPSGTVSFLVVMALIVGGYLSSTIAMAFGGPATRRRRLASLALASVIGALLTDTFAGPVLGAVPTSKFLVLWGLFILVMMAVAFATAALQTVLGAGGHAGRGRRLRDLRRAGLGRHGAVGVPPGLWRIFGPYLPAGAGTTAVRNTIYFDGNAITQVADRPRRLSRRRSGGRDRHTPAAPAERRRGRGRGVRCGGCGRIDRRPEPLIQIPDGANGAFRSTTAGRSSSS